MAKFVKILGVFLTSVSVGFAVFYIFWFFGLLPINPELAVKIPVLAIVLAICFASAWLGYIMATAPSRQERR